MGGETGIDCVRVGCFADDAEGLRLTGPGDRDLVDRVLISGAFDGSDMRMEDAPVDIDDEEVPRTRPARRGGGGGGGFEVAFGGDGDDSVAASSDIGADRSVIFA